MRIEIALRRLRKACVVSSDEGGRIGVGVVDCADAAQSQLLDQPILQRQVRTLNAPLGRAAVRAERVDVQLEHRPAKVRHAAAGFARGRAAKYAGFVAVKRYRLAVALDVCPRRLEVAEGRFGLREVQHHQPARRIVDVHQQHAGLRPFLEPPMVAAIDLDQLAQARPACSWLINLRWSLSARNPQASVRHQLPDRFLGQPDTVAFPELLARQCRPEIGVAIPDDRQGPLGQLRIQPPVARTATLARGQARRARLPVSNHQPLDLPDRQAQAFGRATGLQPQIHHGLDYLQTVEFSHVQCHQSCSVHRRLHDLTGSRQAYRSPKRDISKWLEHDISKKLLHRSD
ncbi:hypothetical protein BVI1335_150020 [Burkholderia vietnamiensis]|nr:hypothetical protein BVI1335_150020 [Burkholderia vietnamiensis]